MTSARSKRSPARSIPDSSKRPRSAARLTATAVPAEVGERPAGYVLSHPWSDIPPALDTPLEALPEHPRPIICTTWRCAAVARRIGAASHIVGALIKHATARGFPTMTLIAVNGSAGFWERHGFARRPPELAAKLRSYEPTAKLMVKPLA